MNQRGQSLVISLLFLTVLVGMATLVVDVGSWYRADRKLQANADAAALAAAQELPMSTAAAQAAALDYADTNDGGVAADGVKFRSTYTVNDTVEVNADRPAPGFFAQLFGRGSVDVRAKAVARTGALSSGIGAAPIAVDWSHEKLHCPEVAPGRQSCWGWRDADGTLHPGEMTSLDFVKTGPGAFRVVNIDGSHGGTGLDDIGAWIEKGFGGPADIDKWYYSDPGDKPNSVHVSDALDWRIANKPELLLPVYDMTQAEGAGFNYHVIGFAVFHVTSYEIHGAKDSRIYGYFMSMIWVGVPSPSGGSGGTSFGARAVELIE